VFYKNHIASTRQTLSLYSSHTYRYIYFELNNISDYRSPFFCAGI